MHSLCMTLMDATHSSPCYCAWMVLPVTSKPELLFLCSMGTIGNPSHQNAHHGTAQPYFTLGMVDYSECIVAKYATILHSPGMTVGLVFSDT